MADITLFKHETKSIESARAREIDGNSWLQVNFSSSGTLTIFTERVEQAEILAEAFRKAFAS